MAYDFTRTPPHMPKFIYVMRLSHAKKLNISLWCAVRHTPQFSYSFLFFAFHSILGLFTHDIARLKKIMVCKDRTLEI